RRGDHRVVRAAEIELAGVAVEDGRLALAGPDAGEGLDPRQGVERVAADEMLRALDRPALPLVLVAPVGADLRRARALGAEVWRQPRGPRRPREHDAQHVRVLVVVDQRA